MADPLFRPQVSDKDRKRWLGEILLAQPVSGTFFAVFSLLVVLGLAAALYFVEYTRKERVTGQLILDKGSSKVYAQATGVIASKLFADGDTVTAGQVLLTINAERSTKLGDTQDEIARQLAMRKGALEAEKAKQRSITNEEEAALKRRANDVRAELDKINNEITTQQKRVALSKSAAQRSRDLQGQQFVSQADVDVKEQDALEQQARLQSLERSSLSLQKDLNAVRSDLQNAPLRANNKASEFDRQIASLMQESLDSESRRELQVRAPQAGKVTAGLVELGQIVTPNAPLLSILPSSATLEALLYLPSKAVGFVEVGQTVQLRYEAYPYQKFGQYEGKVREISRTTLSAEELKVHAASKEGQYKEGLYVVKVVLKTQHVMAYGKPTDLQDGMQVEADVLIDTRKLYEWVLEPLYSLTGKL
jgi:membrane fusion protein